MLLLLLLLLRSVRWRWRPWRMKAVSQVSQMVRVLLRQLQFQAGTGGGNCSFRRACRVRGVLVDIQGGQCERGRRQAEPVCRPPPLLQVNPTA
jgi:hypothetical protein